MIFLEILDCQFQQLYVQAGSAANSFCVWGSTYIEIDKNRVATQRQKHSGKTSAPPFLEAWRRWSIRDKPQVLEGGKSIGTCGGDDLCQGGWAPRTFPSDFGRCRVSPIHMLSESLASKLYNTHPTFLRPFSLSLAHQDQHSSELRSIPAHRDERVRATRSRFVIKSDHHPHSTVAQQRGRTCLKVRGLSAAFDLLVALLINAYAFFKASTVCLTCAFVRLLPFIRCVIAHFTRSSKLCLNVSTTCRCSLTQ
jgi:hypothetical protein